MRCLVVDESATMRRIFRNALQARGCDEILEAADGRQALERAEGPLDLLITDWDLPGMTGLELIKQLRADPGTGSIPVLMVTARSAREDVQAAAQAGVNRYLLKPFVPEALRLKLEELLQPAAAEPDAAAAAEPDTAAAA
jgi:two-component system chemotaxis response regulator CheY